MKRLVALLFVIPSTPSPLLRADVVEDMFFNAPTVYLKKDHPHRDIPRGMVATVKVPDPDPRNRLVTGKFGRGVLTAYKFDDPTSFGETGTGSRDKDLSGQACIDFSVFVSDDAPLGPRDLVLHEGGEERTIKEAIRVVNRIAIVLDIDGLHREVFLETMKSGSLPHLSKIFGKHEGRETIGSLEADRFEHGFAIDEATTIFPSYTLAGHAAIFTGRKPGEYGIPGNEWFDRDGTSGETRRYALTGGVLNMKGHREPWDAKAQSDSDGLANKLLRGTTVYDIVGSEGIQSVVAGNMYFGRSPNTFRTAAAWNEQLMYHLSSTAEWFDDEILKETLQMMGLRTAVLDKDSRIDLTKLGILTLYFAGLDHAGHAFGNIRTTHLERLKAIDGMLGLVKEKLSPAVWQGALWIVTSDHGQSDVKSVFFLREWMDEQGYLVEASLRGHSMSVCPTPRCALRSPAQSNCIVAYNGGSAHIYLRPLTSDPWTKRPGWAQLMEAAGKLEKLDKVDLILVRSPETGDYRVYEHKSGEEPGLISIADYIAGDPCIFTAPRYGWKKSDAAFLIEMIQGMNCDRSGDIVVLPKYPDVHFESIEEKGAHGSLTRNDMLIPLAIARPSYGKLQGLRRLIASSVLIDPEKKPRAGNRDVPRLILNHLHGRVELKPGWTLGRIEVRRTRRLEGPPEIDVRKFNSLEDPDFANFLGWSAPVAAGKEVEFGTIELPYWLWEDRTGSNGGVERQKQDVLRKGRFRGCLPPRYIEDLKSFRLAIAGEMTGADRGERTDGGFMEAWVRSHGSLWFRYDTPKDVKIRVTASPADAVRPLRGTDRFENALQWWQRTRNAIPLRLPSERLKEGSVFKLGNAFEAIAQKSADSKLKTPEDHGRVSDLRKPKEERKLSEGEAVVRYQWSLGAVLPADPGKTEDQDRRIEWVVDFWYMRVGP